MEWRGLTHKDELRVLGRPRETRCSGDCPPHNSQCAWSHHLFCACAHRRKAHSTLRAAKGETRGERGDREKKEIKERRERKGREGGERERAREEGGREGEGSGGGERGEEGWQRSETTIVVILNPTLQNQVALKIFKNS